MKRICPLGEMTTDWRMKRISMHDYPFNPPIRCHISGTGTDAGNMTSDSGMKRNPFVNPAGTLERSGFVLARLFFFDKSDKFLQLKKRREKWQVFFM